MIIFRLALIGGLLVYVIWLSGCEETGCVAEGTLIATPDGVSLVETLKIGDFVLSVDPKNGRAYPARIIGIRSTEQRCFPLTAGNGNTLWLTAEHPVYEPSSGHYREAREWQQGGAAHVLTVEGDGHTIQSATASNLESKRVRVFDLTVDSPHRNFIANGILVHNKAIQPIIPDIPGNYMGWVIATQQNDTSNVIIWDSLPIQATFLSDDFGRSGEYSISPCNSALDSIPPEVCFWDGGEWFINGEGISLIPLDTPIIFDTVQCIQSIVPISLIGFDTVFFFVRTARDTLSLLQPIPKHNLKFEFRLIFRPEI